MLPKNDPTKPAVDTTEQEERFLALLDKHMGILYKVSNAYCREPEDRKDLIQETTAQLWYAFDRYDSEYRFSTWMYRVALNVAIGFYRRETRRKRSISQLSDTSVENIVSPEEDDANPDIALLYRFIDGLKRLDRALVLLYLDNHSYLEIADVLGITETNVATKISRIKVKLRGAFTKHDWSHHGT